MRVTPLHFIVDDVIYYEYDDYLRPPVSKERQELLKKALEEFFKLAMDSNLKCVIKHIKDSPEEDRFVLTSTTTTRIPNV